MVRTKEAEAMAFKDFLEAEGRTGAISGAVKDLGARAAELRKEGRVERAAEQTEEFNELRLQQSRNVIEEQERVAAFRKQTYDVKTDPMFLAASEDVRGEWLQRGADAGFWDSEGIGTVGSIQDARASVESSQTLFTEWMKPVVAAKEKDFNNAQLDVKEYEDKSAGKDLSRDQKYQDLVATRDRTRASYSESLNSFTGHQKNLAAFEEAKDDSDDLDEEKREIYLETFKSVMAYTGDVNEAKRVARNAVKELTGTPASIDGDDLDLDEISEEENPLGFTSEELTSLGGSVPTDELQKSSTEIELSGIESKTDKLAYLSKRIPELKSRLKKRPVKLQGPGTRGEQAFEVAKELNFALRQYKSITGKAYTRRK